MRSPAEQSRASLTNQLLGVQNHPDLNLRSVIARSVSGFAGDERLEVLIQSTAEIAPTGDVDELGGAGIVQHVHAAFMSDDETAFAGTDVGEEGDVSELGELGKRVAQGGRKASDGRWPTLGNQLRRPVGRVFVVLNLSDLEFTAAFVDGGVDGALAVRHAATVCRNRTPVIKRVAGWPGIGGGIEIVIYVPLKARTVKDLTRVGAGNICRRRVGD